MWLRGGPAWQIFTHMMGGKASLALCFAFSSCCCSAVATRLLVVELQILQALRQGQFLLDSHAQQRVQGLLLIFCSSQLPLHIVQLDHVLVTPETKKWGLTCSPVMGRLQGNICSSRRRSFRSTLSNCATFYSFPRLFQMGGCLDSHNYYIRHFPACFVVYRRQKCIQNKQLFQLFMLSTVPIPV